MEVFVGSDMVSSFVFISSMYVYSTYINSNCIEGEATIGSRYRTIKEKCQYFLRLISRAPLGTWFSITSAALTLEHPDSASLAIAAGAGKRSIFDRLVLTIVDKYYQ